MSWVQLEDRVVLGTSCAGYEASWVRVVLGTSRLGYELSWVRGILGTSCPGYESSRVRVVLGTSCPGYELSRSRIDDQSVLLVDYVPLMYIVVMLFLSTLSLF